MLPLTGEPPKAPRQEFPRFSLDEALELARKAYDSGRDLPIASLAAALGKSHKSSSFRQLVAAAKWYGLLEPVGKDSYKPTDLCKTVFDPITEQEKQRGLVQAFRNYGKFASLYDSLPKQTPVSSIGSIAVNNIGVLPVNKDEFIKVFLSSASQAGLLRVEGNSAIKLDPDNEYRQKSLIASRVETTRDAHEGSSQEANLPSLHINIEIHLSADLTPEQIDQIFFSTNSHERKLFERTL